MARATLVIAGALALVPVLTTEAAFQDMSSLLEGSGSQSRWQAYFIPSPAGSIEKAKLSFADASVRRRMPPGAGVHAADGTRYSAETVRPVADSPDEDRIDRSQKRSRVVKIAPVSPPTVFSAGSMLQRQSMLRPGLYLGDKAVLTALAQPATAKDAIVVAMNAHPAAPGSLQRDGAGGILIASTDPIESTGTALGYAAESSAANARTLFEKILKETPSSFIPPLGKDDHAWLESPLPDSVYTEKEQTCLADGIYFEARGESVMGQAAVGQVILNRVRNPAYPNSICGVVYQNSDWRNRCQFSFACDGRRDRILDKAAWNTAKRVADQVTKGEIWVNEVGSATHYHATYVHPRWARAMEKVDKIGRHIFYRTFGGGWN